MLLTIECLIGVLLFTLIVVPRNSDRITGMCSYWIVGYAVVVKSPY